VTGDDRFALSLVVMILLVVVFAIFLMVRSGNATQRKLREAHAEELRQLNDAQANYRRMLEILKRNPTDPDLRQKTLDWGRHYSNLTRQRKGLTIFDEVALSNDISAACAGAARTESYTAAGTSTSSLPVEDRLARLKALLGSGAITDDEYRERRNRLLDEV
jgi:uncharacterized membrane protein